MKRSLKGEGTRRTTSPINVWCNSDERAAITENATACGLSLSGFLREVGLGYSPKRVVDLAHIDTLLRINADLGRLGGLLKLWLSKDERFQPGDPDRRQVTGLVNDIRDTQATLQAAARKILDQF